jgi:DNA uptake protein ComE-like DNA-binding protein
MVRWMYVILTMLVALGALLIGQISTSTTGIDRPTLPVERAPRHTVKINLNTATENELRKLPRVSDRSASAIVESRAKSNFKDWNDLLARRVVPSFAEHAIKDLVTF